MIYGTSHLQRANQEGTPLLCNLTVFVYSFHAFEILEAGQYFFIILVNMVRMLTLDEARVRSPPLFKQAPVLRKQF